jgi:hypothetical protein
MTRLSNEEIVTLVRAHLQPAPAHFTNADLWPQVRERIGRSTPPPSPWEWVLTAVVALACLLEPAVLSVLLLNL